MSVETDAEVMVEPSELSPEEVQEVQDAFDRIMGEGDEGSSEPAKVSQGSDAVVQVEEQEEASKQSSEEVAQKTEENISTTETTASEGAEDDSFGDLKLLAQINYGMSDEEVNQFPNRDSLYSTLRFMDRKASEWSGANGQASESAIPQQEVQRDAGQVGQGTAGSSLIDLDALDLDDEQQAALKPIFEKFSTTEAKLNQIEQMLAQQMQIQHLATQKEANQQFVEQVQAFDEVLGEHPTAFFGADSKSLIGGQFQNRSQAFEFYKTFNQRDLEMGKSPDRKANAYRAMLATHPDPQTILNKKQINAVKGRTKTIKPMNAKAPIPIGLGKNTGLGNSEMESAESYLEDSVFLEAADRILQGN